jgi:hypothetical protein
MKLSNETFVLLKNFGAINPGIYFKKGKTLKTVSSHKNILAKVDISEEIPADFGVFDLNNFLSAVSLHEDVPSFEFDEKHVVIVGNGGRSKTKYRCCESTMLVTPPEKDITLPECEISLELSETDFDWVMKAAAVLASPQVAFESDGLKVSIVTLDLANDAAHSNALEIGKGNGDKYRMIFKTENLTKLLKGSYSVKITSKGISHFKHKNIPLQYWVSTEQGSKFEKAN